MNKKNRKGYNRKLKGKTNYKKRLKLLMSKKPRLVIRKSINNINMQIVEYHADGDKILSSVNSLELKKLGWDLNTGNIPAAYLTGLLLAKKSKNKKISEVIVDIGLNTPTKGSKIFAALKGAIDNGIKTPHSENMFPDEKAISGDKIQQYLDLKDALKSHQFSKYIKNKSNITKKFKEVKDKIMK